MKLLALKFLTLIAIATIGATALASSATLIAQKADCDQKFVAMGELSACYNKVTAQADGELVSEIARIKKDVLIHETEGHFRDLRPHRAILDSQQSTFFKYRRLSSAMAVVEDDGTAADEAYAASSKTLAMTLARLAELEAWK